MNPSSVDGLAVAFVVLRESFTLIALGIALSSIDDLFIDLVYIMQRAWRAVVA